MPRLALLLMMTAMLGAATSPSAPPPADGRPAQPVERPVQPGESSAPPTKGPPPSVPPASTPASSNPPVSTPPAKSPERAPAGQVRTAPGDTSARRQRPARPATARPRRPQTDQRAAARAPATESNLPPEQLDKLICVAEDISPEWAAWLRSRRESDPEGLGKAVQTSGRRLVALTVLRDQSPELYRLKVEELKLQAQTSDAAKRYRLAVSEGRDEEAKALLAELRQKAKEQVDLDLKTRAAELAALDQQVRALKKELTEDTQNRQARIDELLQSLTRSGGEAFIGPPPAEEPATGE